MPSEVHSEILHAGRLLTVERLTVPARAGRGNAPTTRDVIRHPGSVVIVPVRDRDTLVLIRNDRVAVGERLWELPAGTLEPGEAPLEAAGRELAEETGRRASRIAPLASFYASPGFLDEMLHVFVAEDLAFVGQDLDPGESIEAVEVGVDEALAMIDDGRIRDGKTIAGILLWLRRAGAAAR